MEVPTGEAVPSKKSDRPVGRPAAHTTEGKTDEAFLKQVENLASLFLTGSEIAAVLNIDESTLYRNPNIASVLEKGRESGKASLKRAMFMAATEGKNVTAQIWLSKNVLGWKDRVEEEQKSTAVLLIGQIDGLDLLSPSERKHKMLQLATELAARGQLALPEKAGDDDSRSTEAAPAT